MASFLQYTSTIERHYKMEQILNVPLWSTGRNSFLDQMMLIACLPMELWQLIVGYLATLPLSVPVIMYSRSPYLSSKRWDITVALFLDPIWKRNPFEVSILTSGENQTCREFRVHKRNYTSPSSHFQAINEVQKLKEQRFLEPIYQELHHVLTTLFTSMTTCAVQGRSQNKHQNPSWWYNPNKGWRCK